MKYNKVAIVGAGLMGASLAKELQKIKDFAWSIVALVRGEEQAAKVKELNIIATTKYDDLKDADIIFVAVPLSAYEQVFKNLSALEFKKSPIISDLGSVKASVVELADELIADLNFVPSHPIAGSQISGTGKIVDNLYRDRRLIITAEENDISEEIADIWKEIGAKVAYMDAKEHDRTYAYVSHLTQKIAFNLDELLFHTRKTIDALRAEYNSEVFNKFIRLRYSNPDMWADIFTFNKYFVGKALEDFQANLQYLITNCDELIGSTKTDEDLSNKTAKELDLYSAYMTAMILKKTVAEHIDNYTDYIGPGFKDFTAILADQELSIEDLTVGELGFIRDRLSALLNSFS